MVNVIGWNLLYPLHTMQANRYQFMFRTLPVFLSDVVLYYVN